MARSYCARRLQSHLPIGRFKDLSWYRRRFRSSLVQHLAQKTPNLRGGFRKRRLTNTPRRHRLADGPLSSLYAPSLSFSSFGAASVMICCSARPASPSAPSVLPGDRISRKYIRCMRRFCVIPACFWFLTLTLHCQMANEL